MAECVTIVDIAKAAGVSTSTVSRALRNNPIVRKDVRDHVQRVADQLGYRPNAMVSALMERIRMHRTPAAAGNLAYLDWSPQREDFEKLSVVRRFHTGAKQAAELQGYQLEHFYPLVDRLRRETLMSILRARGMTGAVLLIHVDQNPRTRENLSPIADTAHLPLNFNELTTAVIGGKFCVPTPHFAQTDTFAAGRLIAEELLARGYHRPGLVMSSYIDVVTENRLHAGLHAVWSRHRRASSLRNLVIREGDFATALKWIRQEQVDVVIAYTDALCDALRDAGLDSPTQIGFVSTDAIPGGRISGVDQRHEQVGAAAVNLVINQINRDERGMPEVPRGVIIEGAWVEGTTLRPRLKRN